MSRLFKDFTIFAVDFDGTIVKDAFPEIGESNKLIQNFIRTRKRQGDKIILWTCRTGTYLSSAIDYCVKNDIRFDAVNNNIAEVIEKFNGNPRKIYADYYIDDRVAMLVNDLGMTMFPIKLLPIE